MQAMVPSGAALTCSLTGREVKVTSSVMPTVKWFFISPSRLSYTALAMEGVNSLEPRP